MDKKVIIYLGIAVIVFLLFYSILPLSMMHKYTMFWAFLAAGGVGGLIFLAGRLPDEIRYDIEKYKDAQGKERGFIVVAVISGLATLIIVAFHTSTRERNLLRQDGIITEGVILNGQSKKNRRTTTYELTIQYKDGAGHLHVESLDVNSDEWHSAGKDMPVQVIYSQSIPGVCRVLLKPESAREYMKPGERLHPSVADLRKLIHTSSDTARLRLLGKGWLRNQENTQTGKAVYINSFTRDCCMFGDLNGIYFNADGYFNSIEEILKVVKSSMKVKYDSLDRNPVMGSFYQQDSFNIRFQNYSRSAPVENDFGLMGTTIKEIRCFGFNDSGDFILLPGDLSDRPSD